jgi:hypothetical protein
MRPMLIVVGSMLMNSAFGAVPLPASDFESLRPGDRVEAFRFGQRTVRLPIGDWHLVNRSSRPVDVSGRENLGRMARVQLQEIKDGRLNRLLDVSTNDLSVRVNWRNEPCKVQGDSYWIDDRKAGTNNQLCLRVGFVDGIVNKASGNTFVSWARDLKERGIRYSPEMPYVSVTRYTMSSWLSIQLMYDPSVSGIKPSEASERSENDWQPQRAARDLQRSTFYRSLKDWAPQLAVLVQDNLDGNASTPLSEYGAPKFPAPEAGRADSVEQK